eukprot:16081100-Heterocapsa_arctica.AAC.1
MFSGRFDGGDKEKKLRALYDNFQLHHSHLNPFIVKVVGGGDFGAQTFKGLGNMYAMIAFAYDDYGSNTDSPYLSYKELKQCFDQKIHVVP